MDDLHILSWSTNFIQILYRKKHLRIYPKIICSTAIQITYKEYGEKYKLSFDILKERSALILCNIRILANKKNTSRFSSGNFPSSAFTLQAFFMVSSRSRMHLDDQAAKHGTVTSARGRGGCSWNINTRKCFGGYRCESNSLVFRTKLRSLN